MTVLILGTPDSGKSRKAEELMEELSGSSDKIYIATMIPFGTEGEERVKKHRKQREGKGYRTIECPLSVSTIIEKVDDLRDKSCLLECLSNLAGNELHSPENSGVSDDALAGRITDEIMLIGEKCRHLVIVSNRFPAEDPLYDEDTKHYIRFTEVLNEKIRNKADRVFELKEKGWVEG